MSIDNDIEEIKKYIEKEEKEPLKIALFGQPGSGKSSIINSLVGEKVAEVDVRTDTTVDAQIYEYTKDLTLVDLPGYGTSKFPADSFTDKFDPKDYHIFLCVFSGKFHQADNKFFQELKETGKNCHFIRSKLDDIWDANKNLEELKSAIKQDVIEQIGEDKKIYFVSNKTKEGFEELYEAISSDIDDELKDRWHRSAKAYTLQHLQKKQEACKRKITKSAGLAAANGFNPIPGVNVAVDIGILINLFADIKKSYGLSENKINSLSGAVMSGIAPFANKVIEYATKEGLMLLLKEFATTTVVRNVSKYVPMVGQLIAGSVGFAITKGAGDSYLEACHKVAEKILEDELLKQEKKKTEYV